MPVDRDLQRLPGVPVPTVFFVPHLSNATPPISLSLLLLWTPTDNTHLGHPEPSCWDMAYGKDFTAHY